MQRCRLGPVYYFINKIGKLIEPKPGPDYATALNHARSSRAVLTRCAPPGPKLPIRHVPGPRYPCGSAPIFTRKALTAALYVAVLLCHAMQRVLCHIGTPTRARHAGRTTRGGTDNSVHTTLLRPAHAPPSHAHAHACTIKKGTCHVSLCLPSGTLCMTVYSDVLAAARSASMCAGGSSSSLRPETNRIGAVMDGMRALECQPMRSTKLFMGATHGMTTSTMSGIDVNVFSNMSPLTLAQTSADDT